MELMPPQHTCTLWWPSLVAVRSLFCFGNDSGALVSWDRAGSPIQHHSASFMDIFRHCGTSDARPYTANGMCPHLQPTLLSQVRAQPVGRSRVWLYGCWPSPTLGSIVTTLPSESEYPHHSAVSWSVPRA